MTCGHSYCPIFSKVTQFKSQRLDKDNFVGTAPSVFVGRYNYPNLNVGILAPPDKVQEDAELYDAPRQWNARQFGVQDVLSFRGALINSHFKTHIKTRPRFLELSQEVAMAEKPVDVEFLLEKKPVYQIKTSDIETVLGARAELRKAMLQENVRIHPSVEKAVSDADLKAADALQILYKKGLDEALLTRLLSIGNLGVKTQRKLVPTRWSITATDDTIGKHMINEVKQYKESHYHAYFGGYLGNYFLILMFPRVWSYELFEMYMPSTLLNQEKEVKWTTDYEFYEGRKTYAENCVGGYYSSRLGVLEKLRDLKRQSAVIVLRFITDEYTAPLGVWVVREATRNALKHRKDFASENELLSYVRTTITQYFNYNADEILRQSKVLRQIRTQRTIKDFL